MGIRSHTHDAPEGERLLRIMKPVAPNICMIMDRAYEGDQTQQSALELRFTPVVRPKQNHITPWEDGRIMQRRRNEI